jgi:hypothetical protein
MKKLIALTLALMLPCGVATAADGGPDGGADCTYGEADCASDPWMWCSEANEWVETACLESELPEGVAFTYSPCNCDPSDPCGWVDDDYCDEGCLLIPGVDVMFDDSADCTEYDGGTDSDSDADIDVDSDVDTDTGDASPSGESSEGCGCSATGARLDRSLLSLVL